VVSGGNRLAGGSRTAVAESSGDAVHTSAQDGALAAGQEKPEELDALVVRLLVELAIHHP
jgi:hypothetical protein